VGQSLLYKQPRVKQWLFPLPTVGYGVGRASIHLAQLFRNIQIIQIIQIVSALIRLECWKIMDENS
jgi:hypothetical protein